MDKIIRAIATLILGATVFAFWMWLYPQGLNYQEQNQLFLFTWDYLGSRLALPGGLADYLSEFLVQFFYVRWVGALILALLAMALQLAVWRASGAKDGFYALSFLPPLLMLVYQGNMEVLLSFPVALLLAVLLTPLFGKAGWHRLWLIPLGWWLVGPVIAVPTIVSVLRGRKAGDWVMLVWLLITAFAEYRLLASQFPMRDAFFGLNYYRLVESLPVLQVVIPVVTLLCVLACPLKLNPSYAWAVELGALVLFAVGTGIGVRLTYNKDAWELLAYDDLIRHEHYSEVIKRAEKYQPRNAVSACSVNFCLFMERQLDKRMMEFYQCGPEGLVQPSIRDNLSDITSAELLWMMGMPNITLQYSFDLQESIQNARKSGRFMSRIADCNIVNGWYPRAKKYLDILSKSLFYRRWAKEKLALLEDEAKVAADPVYSYVRSVRFKDDFIASYDGFDLMIALLYNQNNNNFMAAEYYSAWQRLKPQEAAR